MSGHGVLEEFEWSNLGTQSSSSTLPPCQILLFLTREILFQCPCCLHTAKAKLGEVRGGDPGPYAHAD
jgi:hypothetical protein